MATFFVREEEQRALVVQKKYLELGTLKGQWHRVPVFFSTFSGFYGERGEKSCWVAVIIYFDSLQVSLLVTLAWTVRSLKFEN